MGQLVILMGPTGAGKSVQGDLLTERNGWVHLSSGRLLRRDPQAAKQLVDGRLAPPEEVHRVVASAMAAVPESQTVVLDGTPRTQSDIDWLDASLSKFHREIVVVMLIELDIETSMTRLGLRGRADDAPDAVRAKWKLFSDVTGPVVEHYRKLGLLVTVDGRGSIEAVHEQIVAALDKVVSA